MDNSKNRDFKGFFWGYVVIACVAMFGGVISIYSRINGITPYLFGLDPTPGPIVTESQERLQALAQKKLLDSDGDTINDFDEEFTYGTSAYLDDSDSDGLLDHVEITNGTDPNCSAGKTCFSGVTSTNANSSVNGADIVGLSTDDPKELRRQLAALGIDQAVLDQVSDEDLLSVYASVQGDYTTNTAPTNTTNGNTNADPYASLLPDTTNTNSVTSVRTGADLQNLTPAAVRTLLLQSGMKQEDLDQVDDATLMKLYQEALQESQPAQ